jgi:hypothetical protein
MEAPSRQRLARNRVLHYLMILRAARDFGLSDGEIAAVAGPFDPRRPRCVELADALADLILARAA